MKFFIKTFLLGVILTTFIGVQAQAVVEVQMKKKPTVAVISDVNHRAGTMYLVTGASADIIASDLITALNNSNYVTAPVLGESMAKISKNLNLYSKTFFDEYKYNYNIDYVNLKRVTQDLDADYLLMVTAGLDVQSNFLKDTVWNKMAIAGVEPVRPTYVLTTLITLIDLNNNKQLWQELYRKDIDANNFDIGVVQFAPSYAQLSKVKKYSQNISEHITPIVNAKINPALERKREVSAVQFKRKDINEESRLYYPVIQGEVIKQKIEEKRQLKETQRAQKLLDEENYRRLKYEQIRQKELEKEKYQRLKYEQMMQRELEKEKYIEDIRNLKQKKESIPEKNTDIKPATLVEPKKEPVTQPINDVKESKKKKPISEDTDIKPATFAEPKEPASQPVNDTYGERPILKPAVQIEEVPSTKKYEWNLKNIYEQKPPEDKLYKRDSSLSKNKNRDPIGLTVFDPNNLI